MRWCTKATEQGYNRAMVGLGRCYANGSGVKQDYVQAYKWLRLAYDLGNQKIGREVAEQEKKLSPKQIDKVSKQVREFKERLGIE